MLVSQILHFFMHLVILFQYAQKQYGKIAFGLNIFVTKQKPSRSLQNVKMLDFSGIHL